VNKEYVVQIVNLFVLKEKRPRFLEFVSSPMGWDGLPKRYDDFLRELLNDPRNLDPGCVAEDLGGDQETSKIVRKLVRLGAGKNAYLVSEASDVDGRLGSLEEVLSLVSGGENSFIASGQR
jgi:hypothetical protein